MKKNKKLFLVAGIVLLVIALFIVIMLVKDSFVVKNDSIICVYDEEKKQSFVYVNEKLVGSVDGKAELENNMDNSAIVIVTDVAVYVMKDQNISKIGDEMSLVTIANFSDVIMLKDTKEALYIYKDSKLEKLTDEKALVAVVSGDGNTFGYSTEEKAYLHYADNDIKTFENVIISHISKDGKYVYATKNTSEKNYELMLIDGDDLISCQKGVNNIVGLNIDGNELMYTTKNGTFVMVDGKDTYQVSEKFVYEIYYFDEEYTNNGDFWAIDTLKGKLCQIVDGTENTISSICKLNNGYMAEIIVEKCFAFIGIDSTMDRFFYKDAEENLYRIDAKVDAKPEMLAENVDLARIAPDGKNVYFTRKGGQNVDVLYWSEKGLNEKEMAYMYDFFDIIVFDNHCYIEANDIYLVKGEKVEKLEDLSTLKSFFIDYLAQKAYGYDENNLYVIKKGKKIKLEGEFEKLSFYDYLY